MTTPNQAPAADAGTAAAALDSVEIFSPGRHLALSGALIEFSAADVAAIAAAYDPALHEAPHVVGHPKTDAPAYGWVRRLGVNDAGRLCVTESAQVEPQFAELVVDGRFKKRSAAFYPPQHPSNPKPGQWYLKHVGWLGATPPAVKGLADVAAYGEAEAGIVEFAGWDDELNAGMWRRLRDWFIGQFGLEAADKVIPAWDVDALQREAMRPEPEATATPAPLFPTTAFAEGDPAVSDTTTAELEAARARIRDLEAAQAAAARQAREAGIAAFADGLVHRGVLLPAERAAIVAALGAVPDTAEVEFAETDGAQPVKTGALATLQRFLSGLPPRVEFAELAGTARTGAALDLQDPQAIARAAQEFCDAETRAGRTVSFDVAVAHVVRNTGAAAS